MPTFAAPLVINRTVSHALRITFFRATRALGGLDAHGVFDADVTIGQTTIVLIWQIAHCIQWYNVDLGTSRNTAT
jgi:hypothetical protein